MRRYFVAFLAVSAFALVGCGGDSMTEPPPPPEVDGSWQGTSDNLTFTLTLNESSDGSISGGGNISGPGGSASLNVTGTHVHPDVTLQMTSSGFEDINFSGELQTESRMVGNLNGSGFSGDQIIFNKQ